MKLICLMLTGSLAAMASAAHALPKVSEKVVYYEIGGQTGRDLYAEMGRKGPRHGFMAKAIAQTQFKHQILGKMVNEGGTCRSKGGGFALQITYVYPKPARRLTGDLARRWKAFQSDNFRHEKVHGRIAKAMAIKLDRAIARFSMKDGPSCSRAMAALKKQTGRIMAQSIVEQKAFDEREHRQGGAVERSVVELIGKGS